MKRTIGLARKGASLGISLLMLAMSLTVPVLERAEMVDGPVAESEHDLATCPTAHDHRICTQVGANLSATSRVQEHRLAYAVVPVATRPRDSQGGLRQHSPRGIPPEHLP